MKKKILYTSLIIIALIIIWNYELISYGLMQANGQLRIMFNTRPISEVLADKGFPDSLKTKLLLIQEIKKFAIDSLGLNPSESYEELYDQEGKPILWTLTVCEPYRLEAKEWSFPFIGTFSYKGFFDFEKLKAEEKVWQVQGMDTDIDEVSAWSTLGYLDDPVLSSFLRRQAGSLANLIIHELTHGTLFIDDDLAYNENLANFVGNEGAIRFLRYKFGENSKELNEYLGTRKDREILNHFLLQSTQSLDSLYKSFDEKTDIKTKSDLKAKIIEKIVNQVNLLPLQSDIYKNYFEDYQPNNAFFIGFLTYNEKQNEFEQEFQNQFKGDFKKYMNYLKKKYER